MDGYKIQNTKEAKVKKYGIVKAVIFQNSMLVNN